jgi:hypothetical protein
MRRSCTVLIAVLTLASGCADPKCPPGYLQKGDTCYRCRSIAGVDGGACVVGDAAVSPDEDEDEAGSRSDMDSGSSDHEEASDDADSVQEHDPSAEDAGTGAAVGSDDDAEMPSRCSADSGAGGNACQVDQCNPSPCGAGFTCSPTPSGTASCVASCADGDLGCQPGDPCSTDEECSSGGDSNASCDPEGKVCVTVCPTTSIVSQANLDAARYCREINGDLIVNPNFATIPANALPYLTRIRGAFNADLSGVLNTGAQSITLSALRTVDGRLLSDSFRILPC